MRNRLDENKISSPWLAFKSCLLTASLFLFAFTIAFSQPTVDTPTATGIGTTTATLGGKVTGTLTHRGTRWSSVSPVTAADNQQEDASTTAGVFTQTRTGLPTATKIFFVAYARNGVPEGTAAETTFFTEPTQLVGGEFTAVASAFNAITLTFPAANSWKGTGATAGYVIYRKSGSAPSLGALADGAAPPADGAGDKITTITNGALTSYSDNTGLSAATDYYYTIIPFVWDGALATTYNYNMAAPQTANDFSLSIEPGSHATGTITATAISSSQINLSFNSITTSAIADATGYIVLVKSSAIVVGDLATLADGAAPNSFGLFEAIINSTATGTYSDISGLSANTTYHYAIIPYNRGTSDETYNYLTTTGFATGSATTLSGAATITPINGGTAPVISSTILSAGSALQVLAGFSVTSDGTQVINDIGFNYTGLAGQFTDEYLYRSTTAGSIGTELLVDHSPDGNFDISGLAAGNKTINSTPVYYYLLVDVASSVTSATASVTVNPTQANINVASGTVNAFSINRTFTFGTSQLSDIILTGGTTASIGYRPFVANSINDDQSNSVSLADFQIRDGGASNDDDNKGMTITSIQIQITNSDNLKRIALFDDVANTEIAGTEQAPVGTGTVTVTFTPSTPISVSDNGTFNINVRATFKSLVTDKQSIQISIVSATASGGALSGFSPIGSWASTQTANNTNVIAVNVSKLIFFTNPPTTAVNTNFSLNVNAVDGNPYNNRDLDYTGKVDLTATGGAGTLTGGAQSLSPNLIAGQFTWNQLKISQAGSYTLTASDDLYEGQPQNPTDIGDAGGGIAITSSASNITQPAALNMCFGGNFKNLGNIVVTESDASGFSSGGTFSVSLPPGFLFDQSVTTAPLVGGGSDISAASNLSYPGSNIVEFNFTITGSANINSITISGLRIQYPHPGGANPAPVGGSITRSGGSAIIAGVISGTTLGSVNAAIGSPPPVGLGFNVEKLNPGDVDVASGETRFSVNSNPIKLVGTPAGGGAGTEFFGPGVTFISGTYRFNPNSLIPGSYTITYRHKTGSGDNCEYQVSKSFEVYTTNITNLNAQYCNNSPATPTLDASNYINLYLNTDYVFQRFVYWNTPGGRNTDGTINAGAPVGPVNLANTTVPASNKIFDPQLADYQPVYSATASVYGLTGIWIGFEVHYNPGNYNTVIWNLIAVKPAPAISFIIPKVAFCDDELPVVLIGNPPNSNDISTDKFEYSPAQGIPPINSAGDPVVWTFDPKKVDNVTVGNPQAIDITYTYVDPATNCKSTSPPINITVNKRPKVIIANDIISPEGPVVELCQGQKVPEFKAAPQNGITYTWYADISLKNKVGSGEKFLPPVDKNLLGTTNFFVTKTNTGCESDAGNLSVTVRQLPKMSLTWNNVCKDDLTGLSGTQFLATELSQPSITNLTYNWDFNVTNSLTYSSAGSGANPQVSYKIDGKDSVLLIATTQFLCADTVKKPIYIVPKFAKLTKDNSYAQNFKTDPDGWLIGGTNPSWEWGTLESKGQQDPLTHDKGWDTNLKTSVNKGYSNQNEQSWVLSRCFNFTESEKPVIGLDIFSDTPSVVDGAVLQFNTNGNIEDDASWTTLGEVDKGINWYDAQGISSKPGNQAVNDLGWTGNESTTSGKYKEWQRAYYRLDDLKGFDNVVFRIAFASRTGQTDGFAFDDFFIGERSRVVLLENFTNSSSDVSVNNNTYKGLGNTSDLVKVQYHTPFPGDDPINKLNTPMHNARTAFYGITTSPTMRLDGLDKGSNTLAKLYDNRLLTPSSVEITITTTKIDGVVNIITSIKNKSSQDLPLAGAHIFTTIVQKSITSAALLGASGNTEFVYVGKQMLPSPSGIEIPNDLVAGDTYVAPPVPWEVNNGDAIVVSVQSIEGNNKEVYQAGISLNPPQPDLVTGIETIAEYIQLYPNPANDSFVIELPTKTETRLRVNLIDQVGRPVQEAVFEVGEQTKTIDTQNLAGGIYIVQIGAGKLGVVRKKMMIVHKN